MTRSDGASTQHDSLVEQLLRECMERLEREGADFLPGFYAQHPSVAETIQGELEFLYGPDLRGWQDDQPEKIGPYTLRRLDSGGMGDVYVALRNEPFRQVVALKLIKHGRLRDDLLARFENEIAVLAMLDHSGIARVLDSGTTDDGRPYFTMEYVPGSAWITDFCRRHALDIPARVRLFRTVCRAVEYAHQKSVIHRDLKPSNILVRGTPEAPEPKIIDFGLAKVLDPDGSGRAPLSLEGLPLGTFEYMSPEQAAGSPLVDTRTDVYSMGAVFYELVTGHAPLQFDRGSQSWDEIVSEIRGREPTLPSRSDRSILRSSLDRDDLDAIVMCALEKDPDQRYASIGALAADLDNYLAQRPVAARRQTRTYLLAKFVRRNRAAVSVVALFFVVLLVATGVSLAFYRESERSLEEFQMLGLGTGLRTLQRQELTDPPVASPSGLPGLLEWKRRVGEIFAQRRRLSSYLAAAGDEAPEVTDWESGPSARRELRRSIEALLRLMDEMQADQGVCAMVDKRVEWAEKVAALTLEDSRWPATIAAVASNPKYGDLVLQPRIGLVPIGRDEGSQLEEFAFALPGGTPPERDADGRIIPGPDTWPVFVLLPGGSFTTGSQDDDSEAPRYDPHRQPLEPGIASHRIPAFYASKFEFTHGQWKLLRERDLAAQYYLPERNVLVDRTHPVMGVFGDHLRHLLVGWGMRLPTAAEWEYLARAGSDDPWSCGPDVDCLPAVANVADQSMIAAQVTPDGTLAPWNDRFPLTAPVGTFAANRFGIYDVHGNVGELCTTAGGWLAVRGGSWHQPPLSTRFTKSIQWRGQGQMSIGFRPALSLQPE